MIRAWTARAIAVGLLLAGGIALGHAPAHAAGDPQAKMNKVNELAMQGRTPKQIATMTGLVLVSDPETDSEGIVPMSDGSDYSVGKPIIFYDAPSRSYVAQVSYNWKTTAYRGDCGYYPGSCGGADGFAIRVSKSVNELGSSRYFCYSNWYGATPYPSKPSCSSSSWVYDNNEHGTTIGFRDKVRSSKCSGTDYWSCATYLGYSGSLTWRFKTLSGGCHQFWARYEHTWSSTGLTGFSVNASGFSAQFSKSSNHQQATTPISGKMGC